jgi:hypothetical protein
MVTDVSAVEGRQGSPSSAPRKAAASAVAVVRSGGRVGQVVRFLWHFVQMAIAMEIGMEIGMAPPVLSALGLSHPGTRSPEAYALEMTVSMVGPMAAWMLIRRHGWERTAEMAAAMTVPIVVLAAGSLIGLLPHSAARTGMNTLMWVALLGAMLFGWPDYSQHRHGHGMETAVA